jgi:sugar O-acyltransferase (sialic acid O-acetyltransferase NeuD family)
MSAVSPNPGRLIVIGSSGHAKVVLDVAERGGSYAVAGLLDDFQSPGTTSFGYSVLGAIDALPELRSASRVDAVFVAIGDNWLRHQVVARIQGLAPELPFAKLIHPSAQVARGVAIGQGAVVMAGAVVNSEARIGEFCIVNTQAVAEHDCVLGDYSSLAPGAILGGGVELGPFAAVCLGAKVIHRRRIGRNAVLGAGAVALEDVPDDTVAYGVPARVIRSRRPGERYL